MTTTLQQWANSQSNPELTVNENFASLSHTGCYAMRPAATTGLVWAWYGGRWGGQVVADGTATLGASTTSYVTVNRSTGAVAVATTTTAWDDTTNHARAYKLTTGTATVAAVEDHRAGPGGVHGQGAGSSGSGIEVLTAPRTYYVRTDGSDTNSGLADTAGGAFLTIQRAVDVIASTLDNNGHAVTVSVAAGTYSAALRLKPTRGHGTCYIDGLSGTPSAVHISVTSASAIQQVQPGAGSWLVRYLKVSAATSGYGIVALGCSIGAQGVVFGACASGHIYAANGGAVQIITNATVEGAAPYWARCVYGGAVQASGTTLTITGTPAFSQAFIFGDYGGQFAMDGMTFSGTATGKRYTLQRRSAFFGSASTTYLPGNVAGTTTAESFYGTGV